MRGLSWIVLFVAMLTVVIFGLMTRTNVVAEKEEKTEVEKREWGKEVDGCRVSIQLKDYDEKKYGLVTLSLIFKRTGERRVRFEEPSLWTHYNLTVKNAKGERVPLTRYAEHLVRQSPDRKTVLVELPPDGQREYLLPMSRYYDMTLPGTYTISATLADCFITSNESIPLVSNTITVKVPE